MKRIVTIGGGTGSYTVLYGMKNLKDISLTALVSMADDGGTNGMLRKELGVLPPSDVRQCLVALSDEELLSKLMSYRFTEGILSGHSFGSIFIATLEKVTGDFTKAIQEVSKILKIRSKIIPITKDNAELCVSLVSGTTIQGEHNIDEAKVQYSEVKKIFYKNKVELNSDAKDAILDADYIIICPGDFYTSIVPNLIVEGFKEALLESKAKIIAIENLDNQDTNTYLSKLEWYLGKPIDNLISRNKSLMSHESINKNSVDVLERSFIRHDAKKLAKCIKKIINK